MPNFGSIEGKINFLAIWAAKRWNELPREVMSSLSWKVLNGGCRALGMTSQNTPEWTSVSLGPFHLLLLRPYQPHHGRKGLGLSQRFLVSLFGVINYSFHSTLQSYFWDQCQAHWVTVCKNSFYLPFGRNKTGSCWYPAPFIPGLCNASKMPHVHSPPKTLRRPSVQT